MTLHPAFQAQRTNKPPKIPLRQTAFMAGLSASRTGGVTPPVPGRGHPAPETFPSRPDHRGTGVAVLPAVVVPVAVDTATEGTRPGVGPTPPGVTCLDNRPSAVGAGPGVRLGGPRDASASPGLPVAVRHGPVALATIPQKAGGLKGASVMVVRASGPAGVRQTRKAAVVPRGHTAAPGQTNFLFLTINPPWASYRRRLLH